MNYAPEPQPLLNPITDTCRILNIGRTNLDRLIKDGKLKAVRIGRKVMVPTASIEAFIESLPSKAA
jgi:excisionase family DNA binding protein